MITKAICVKPACGRANAPSAKFCSNCGTRLEHEAEDEASTPKAVVVLDTDWFVCQQCGSKSPVSSAVQYRCQGCGKMICSDCAGRKGIGEFLSAFDPGQTYCPPCQTSRTLTSIGFVILIVIIFVVILIAIGASSH